MVSTVYQRTPMHTINRHAAVVIPKKPLLDWLRSIDASNADMTLADITAEPSVYLLDESDDELSTLPRHFAAIFEEELIGWWTHQPDWPAQRDWATFQKWFKVTIHTMVFDTSARALKKER